MRKIKAVIFDLGDTLLYFNGDWNENEVPIETFFNVVHVVDFCIGECRVVNSIN